MKVHMNDLVRITLCLVLQRVFKENTCEFLFRIQLSVHERSQLHWIQSYDRENETSL